MKGEMKMERYAMMDFILEVYSTHHSPEELQNLEHDLEYMTNSQLADLLEDTQYEFMPPPEYDDDRGDYGHIPY
jgi:hypothetical protein